MNKSIRQAVFIVIAAAIVFGGVYLVSHPKGNGTAVDGQGLQDPVVQQQIKDLEAKVSSNPQDATLLSQLGDLYITGYQFDKAESVLRKAIEIDSGNAVYHFQYGLSMFYQGKAADAIAELRRAVSLDDQSVGAHYYLAIALSHNGDNAGALTEYQKVVALAPDTSLGQKAKDAISRSGGSTSGTPGPGQTPGAAALSASTTGKVGSTLSLDGAAVKVESVKDWSGDGTLKAGEGKKLVQVNARVTNQGDKLLAVSADRFAVADGTGMVTPIMQGYLDRFPTTDLAKGESATGVIIFEVKSDAKLTVLYKSSSFGSGFVTFEMP